jgi:hypothetical protein
METSARREPRFDVWPSADGVAGVLRFANEVVPAVRSAVA